MAGLFDFKSAEQILQERRATTEQNRLQMLKDVSQGAKRPEVVRLGANLGYLLGKSLFGGKSEKEQLTEAREMGETTQAMEQAGVGGEGSAQWDGEGSSYGAGVLQQAQGEEQRRMGLLSEDVQQAERVRIGMERTPEDLDLVGRYRYMAKVLQNAGFTTRAAQAAFLADKEVQRQKEFQDNLTLKQDEFTYEKQQDADKASSEKRGREAEAAYAQRLGAPQEVQEAIIGGSMSMRDWMESMKIGKESQSAAKRKMNELIAQGVSSDKAFEIAYGLSKIFTDPYDGSITKVDLVGNAPPQTILPGNKEFVRINDGVTDLSSALTRADILANKPVWKQIKENIIDKGKDIPGLGFIESKIPGFANTPEGVRNQQLVAQLQNITLKNRSGASVSSPEFERLKTELATGSFNTEREKMIAINRMYEIAQAHESGIRAGYGEDVNKEFDARWNSFEPPKNSLPPSGENGEDANPNDIIWEGL